MWKSSWRDASEGVLCSPLASSCSISITTTMVELVGKGYHWAAFSCPVSSQDIPPMQGDLISPKANEGSQDALLTRCFTTGAWVVHTTVCGFIHWWLLGAPQHGPAAVSNSRARHSVTSPFGKEEKKGGFSDHCQTMHLFRAPKSCPRPTHTVWILTGEGSYICRLS